MLPRRALFAALAALAVAGCAGVAREPAAPTLTVATFNIWHNQGDWAARLPLIVASLRAQDADVIALQEVLEDAGVALPNQARTIADALGGYQVVFVSTDAEGAPRRYGNAILTRLPIIQQDWKKLEPLDDYRTAVRVRVSLNGRPIDIVDTHLAWQDDAAPVRARQIADLMGWIPQGEAIPLIVMGDFNAVQEDAGLAVLTAPRFFSALPRNSAPTTLNPAKGHAERVIDHIFVEAERFAPVSARVFADTPTNGEYPSDHFGVAATVRLR